jgi:hypothetical protein
MAEWNRRVLSHARRVFLSECLKVKESLGRPSCRRKNNNKMNIEDIGREGVEDLVVSCCEHNNETSVSI